MGEEKNDSSKSYQEEEVGNPKSAFQEPPFLKAMRRILGGEGPGLGPRELSEKLLGILDRESPCACISGPLKALSGFEMGKDGCQEQMGTAIQVLEALSNAVNHPYLVPDRLLERARQLHEEILAGRVEKAIESSDREILSKTLATVVPSFAGIPAFQTGRLFLRQAGFLSFEGRRGVFLKYQACREGCSDITLMALEDEGDSKAPEVHFQGHSFRFLRHEGHTLISWRGDRDGWLYFLVTHCPPKNGLALAELMRRPQSAFQYK